MDPIRLIIWDLDGVFWRGTYSESGIEYLQAQHDAVLELARRGILSSICSKNDLAPVQEELESRGIWQSFIFPSIDWSPKAGRIAQIIARAQLRPHSVLFIDDEPANLAEASTTTPGLQIAGPEILHQLLDDPRLAGRPDPGLIRLAQYKILASRAADQPVAAQTNHDFLRASQIRISIETELAPHFARIIEMINRTNQLNFTKNRLPEDPASARAALASDLAGAFSGIIRFTDRYGDYGMTGFFNLHGAGPEARLKHFCFSCRLLNTGIEAFLYAWLGRPHLAVHGAVAGDPFADTPDWITLGHAPAPPASAPRKILDRLVMRGGCDVFSMSPYLAPLATEGYQELNLARWNRQFRIDHAIFLNLAFNPPSPDVARALASIGYQPEDYTSALALPPAPRTAWIFSFWTDAYLFLYKHKTLDLAVPFLMEDSDHHATQDVTALSHAQARAMMNDENYAAWCALREDFWGIGPIFEALLDTALDRLAQAVLARNALAIVILAPEFVQAHPRADIARFNGWIRARLGNAPHIALVEFGDFITREEAYLEPFHFHRQDYLRVAEKVRGIIEEKFK